MSNNKIVPAGETMPQQEAKADDFREDGPGSCTLFVENAYVVNTIIGIANVDKGNDWIYSVHSPAQEMGAYESLWMSPSASFRGLAEVLGAEYETLPSKFVDTDIAIDMAEEVYRQFDKANVHGVEIVARRDPRYPIRMLDAKHRVQLFYYMGDARHLNTRCVSVIGSKNASPEGKRRAARLTRTLVESGFTIISGLSRGIETVAAKTALDCGGKVIAVLGTPITECNPEENKKLQEEVSMKHLLISQVPMMRYSMQTEKENRMFFRERYATMSALSEALLIVEVGGGSDVLSQARAAFYQKRKVLMHNSCFKDTRLTWPTQFEKRGAIRIRSSRGLVKVLAAPPPHISKEFSVPLRQEGETEEDHVQRMCDCVDSGAVPGYAPATAVDRQQSGSSVGKYWRLMNKVNRQFNFLDWFESRRKGGEVLEVPESLPPE